MVVRLMAAADEVIALLVGAIVLVVLKADRIENQVIMDVIPVHVGGEDKFILAVQDLPRQLHADLVGFLRHDLSRLKRLDEVATERPGTCPYRMDFSGYGCSLPQCQVMNSKMEKISFSVKRKVRVAFLLICLASFIISNREWIGSSPCSLILKKPEQNLNLLRFSLTVLCFVAFAPCPHGIQNRFQTFSQVGQAVLYPGRNFCVHMASNKPFIFHVSKLGSQYQMQDWLTAQKIMQVILNEKEELTHSPKNGHKAG